MRVADYIAIKLEEAGLRHVFMVTGGGAMHLNDAFGRSTKLSVVCCHHEQACAMAAEGYFRVSNKVAAVNVTTGPGGTNALTGVYGAYVDSMAMIVISGQVKRATLVSSTNLPLRQLGDQEADIIRMVDGITKYAVLVTEPESIRYHLERAIHLATSGRPGPVWLDIPIDVQAAPIDPLILKSYDPVEDDPIFETENLHSEAQRIANHLRSVKRPVIYAGTGIRLAGQCDLLLTLAERLGIPLIGAWNSNDLIPTQHPCYAGRPGSIGDRPGNFTVQNADFLLILGCRMNIRLVSYNWENFAPNATIAMVDIDAAELKKPTLHVDFPIHADLRHFLPALEKETRNWQSIHSDWMQWCKERVRKYPVVLPEYWTIDAPVNPYCFVERLFSQLKEGERIVCGDGTACVTAFQAAFIRNGQRLFHNSGCASMGYDLPAAIGVAYASPHLARIVCLAGDGSIMMNLQELQTIAGANLPIKIFILNNRGYHSIRQTQKNFFSDNIVGCGTDSGLSFPDFSEISRAFGLPFSRCDSHSTLDNQIIETLATAGPAVCEIILDLEQPFSPKLASKKLETGQMITPPLEDMAPFLDRDELSSNILFPPDPGNR